MSSTKIFPHLIIGVVLKVILNAQAKNHVTCKSFHEIMKTTGTYSQYAMDASCIQLEIIRTFKYININKAQGDSI